ncbi:hypothetical protein BC830DRAFT_1174885 [Chytriomyces sp. MP71]|nr:hypothetical protein BC830DRAFT_1174885 [Chytriomyces sp. MP71]
MDQTKTNGSLDYNALEVANVWDSQTQVYEISAWATAAMSLLQVMILATQIFWIEPGRLASHAAAWKATTRPANLQIFFMILATCGKVISFNYNWFTVDMVGGSVTYALSCFFTTSFQILMLFYTWNRGHAVVELVRPGSMAAILGVLCLLPILQTTSNALLAVAVTINYVTGESYYNTYWIVGGYLGIAGAILFAAFECFILFCYFLYLRQMTRENRNNDGERLLVISRYGVVTMVWNLLHLVVIRVLMGYDWILTDVLNVQCYVVLAALDILMPIVYIFIQLGMKWALHEAKLRDSNRKKSAIHNARKAIQPDNGSYPTSKSETHGKSALSKDEAC